VTILARRSCSILESLFEAGVRFSGSWLWHPAVGWLFGLMLHLGKNVINPCSGFNISERQPPRGHTSTGPDMNQFALGCVLCQHSVRQMVGRPGVLSPSPPTPFFVREHDLCSVACSALRSQ
jgi:hypothetical protein